MANNTTFSLYISLSLLLTLTSAFSPTDHYLLNCGSAAPETLDPDHRTFTGDAPRFSVITRTIPLQNNDSRLGSSSPLYDTARAFTSPVRYVFPIKDQGTHHLVRLHFHPVCNDRIDLHDAQFHILANGFLLLSDFRISKNDSLPVIKEFMLPIEAEKLEIELIPSEGSRSGFVSAIEVFSAPKDLVPDIAQFVGLDRNDKVTGLLTNGFEMVHRVNVGGFKVTPFNDSLWRTWVTDDQHFSLSDGGLGKNIETVHFGGRINYQLGGASREVGPDSVYNTARVIKSSDNAVPNVNMTWKFEVEKGYNYMVRMHFCDIASLANNMLSFNAYVNGNLAYENLDLTAFTNGHLASPFYADFVVDDASSGVLDVSVGPSNASFPRAIDAILNGVEIWKLNNSMGSFGGEVCAEFVRKSWRSEHAGVSVPLVIFAAIILLGASVVLQRRSSSMGWTQLPVHAPEVNLRGGNQLASYKV